MKLNEYFGKFIIENEDKIVAISKRAIRTCAQTAIATIGTSAVLSAVDWKMVVSASALSGLLSILTSIATGLPEVEAKE